MLELLRTELGICLLFLACMMLEGSIEIGLEVKDPTRLNRKGPRRHGHLRPGRGICEMAYLS